MSDQGYNPIGWSNELNLLGDEVHVFKCDIRELDLEHLRPLLTLNEKNKALAFRMDADTKRFITGRIVAKKLLAFYKKMDAADIVINLGKNGRPMVNAGSELIWPSFNISHSGDVVLIAFHKTIVGVDVELVNTLEKADLAGAVFSDEELRLYKTSRDTNAAFYRLWTRKEALLKAVGVGLVDELTAIDVSQQVDVIFAAQHTTIALDLVTFSIQEREKYIGSLCYPEVSMIRFIHVTNDLLSRI